MVSFRQSLLPDIEGARNRVPTFISTMRRAIGGADISEEATRMEFDAASQYSGHAP